MSEVSRSKALAEGAMDRIVAHFGMKETTVEGNPFMVLKSAMSPAPVGWVRVFEGGPLQKLVNVGLVVPQFGLDSHMVFAFTKADSPIPHFTVDSVKTGDFFAFHLDLIPRADLGANLAYMNATLHPLTEAFEAGKAIEGLSPAKLTPRQIALMSPWMLAYRATESAFTAVTTPVNAYLEHWLKLMDKGISPEITETFEKGTFAKRDKANREALFSPEVDPVWIQVERLLGSEVCLRMRDFLKK